MTNRSYYDARVAEGWVPVVCVHYGVGPRELWHRSDNPARVDGYISQATWDEYESRWQSVEQFGEMIERLLSH